MLVQRRTFLLLDFLYTGQPANSGQTFLLSDGTFINQSHMEPPRAKERARSANPLDPRKHLAYITRCPSLGPRFKPCGSYLFMAPAYRVPNLAPCFLAEASKSSTLRTSWKRTKSVTHPPLPAGSGARLVLQWAFSCQWQNRFRPVQLQGQWV